MDNDSGARQHRYRTTPEQAYRDSCEARRRYLDGHAVSGRSAHRRKQVRPAIHRDSDRVPEYAPQPQTITGFTKLVMADDDD